MRTTCIYHKNCFDGICSALIVSKRYPDAEFIPMNYGDEMPVSIEEESKIIMVDFSLPRVNLEAMNRAGYDVLVLDHHKTAQKELEGLPFAIFDMNESGASLTWKYFFPDEPLPILVRYIKDRDLWLFKEPDSEAINSYIQSFPLELEKYEMLFLELEYPIRLFNAKNAGESILRYKNTKVKDMCKYAKIMNLGGYEVPVANATTLYSEVGNELCKLYPDYPFSAYYIDRLSDGIRQWGLRSIGDFDVSELAKRLGGGGHKNSAGFTEKLT